MAAQQLIAGIGALGSSVFRASRSTLWPQCFLYCPSLRRIVSRVRVTAEFLLPSRHVGGARTARRRHVISLRPHFLGEKCRYEKPTLQLSSYVIDARVFHMMRRRFTLVFVASKALNHLQLSLTIARIC
ncbi:hypothetical protein [Burkholderia sp. RF2-non_BP3]|uniref:hypothetical protein n=1 Tax=Burkholderia sp. RF2-non_BP3 TaxID=1637844 RepID=UPI0015CF95F4|nr:hypothetical protein [Burkholderia sp. RF2-non_BP3]